MNFFSRLKNTIKKLFYGKRKTNLGIDSNHEDDTAPDTTSKNDLDESGRNKLSILFTRTKDKVLQITTHLSNITSAKRSRAKHHPFSAVWNLLRKINFDKIFKTVFSPYSRRYIHTGFIIIFITSGTYLLGRILARALTPSDSAVMNSSTARISPAIAVRYSSDLATIKNNDLFRAQGPKKLFSPAKNIQSDPEVCLDARRPSRLPYKLLHTIVLQGGVKSMAALQTKNGTKIKHIREGDHFEDVVVGKISRLRVTFSNKQTRQCEYIERKNYGEERLWSRRKPQILEPEAGAAAIKAATDSRIVQTGNTFKIENSVKEEAIKDINRVLTEARAVQIKNPDGSLCFKMVEIVPGSIYSKLDIQNDDVICNINGNKIENLNGLISLFGRIQEVQDFEMVIRRGGQDINREYNFQ